MAAINKDKFFETIGYQPHRRQKLFHTSTARFKIPVCGRRFGKSTMAARDLEPELLEPKRRYWIIAPTYDLGEKEFRVIWNDLIIGQKLGRDKRTKRAYNIKQGQMFIEFPWGTRVEVRSAMHPESLVGEGLHGAIMSEAAKHSYDTWERYIRPALADFKGWATFPTTPEGQNWLHKHWQYGRNPDPAFVDYESWRFPSWENPYLYPGGRDDPEIKLLELTMSPEWFAQEIAADFTAFVGKIYGEFTEDVHVRRIEYNPDWPNYLMLDFGFVNPFCALDVQIDPWDNVYVWREHYGSYKTLEQHLNEMAARPQPPGYKIDTAFGDAADPEAATYISQHLVPCMADPLAKENWREGVELVKLFLKQYETGLSADEYGTPLMKSKFAVDFSCENMIREFNNYKAPEPSRNTRNKKAPRETAQTIDDHALDAVRYGLMHLYKLGARHHLAEVMGSSGATKSADSETFFTSGVSF